MGLGKKLDLLYFLFMQYILPTAAIPDLVMMTTNHGLPLLSPLTSLMLSLSFWAMLVGLRRTHTEEKLSFSQLLGLTGQSLRGMVYIVHWFVIIPSITARMSLRPKRLKWVKTVHEGTAEESFEF